jgi:hypothetical protein
MFSHRSKTFSTTLLKAVLFMIIPFVLFSCMVEQKALIRSDGSGSVDFRFKMEDYFLDTVLEMADLAEESPTLKEGEIFDIPQIKKDFEENPAIKLESIASPHPSQLKGTITFKDIEKVVKHEEDLVESDAITFDREGATKTMTLHLTRENFSQIAGLFPVLENPFFKMFGPEENADTTEEEYLEMIAFAFGEEGAKGVQNSTITLIVTVDGTIVSQSGGTMEKNRVVFDIPLIRLLLLDTPLTYSISFN